MSGSAECRNQPPRGKRAQQLLIGLTTRSPERVRMTRAFLLTMTYMDAGDTAKACLTALITNLKVAFLLHKRETYDGSLWHLFREEAGVCPTSGTWFGFLPYAKPGPRSVPGGTRKLKLPKREGSSHSSGGSGRQTQWPERS